MFGFFRGFRRTNSADERGATLVEMLGVLAVIGALGTGVIAAINGAMSHFRRNQTSSQLEVVVRNIRKLYTNELDYSDITIPLLVSENIFPKEMIRPADPSKARLATGGYISAINPVPSGFTLVMDTQKPLECSHILSKYNTFGKGSQLPFEIDLDSGARRWTWTASTNCTVGTVLHFDCLTAAVATNLCFDGDNDHTLKFSFY